MHQLDVWPSEKVEGWSVLLKKKYFYYFLYDALELCLSPGYDEGGGIVDCRLAKEIHNREHF